MLNKKIYKLITRENYKAEYIYGQEYAFSYQERYLIDFNNFTLSLIIATQHHDKSEKYNFGIMDKEIIDDESIKLTFSNIQGLPYGVKICRNEEDMLTTINKLIKRDKEISNLKGA